MTVIAKRALGQAPPGPTQASSLAAWSSHHNAPSDNYLINDCWSLIVCSKCMQHLYAASLWPSLELQVGRAQTCLVWVPSIQWILKG